MRERLWRLSGGSVVAALSAAVMTIPAGGLGVIVQSLPISVHDCEQVCAITNWLSAWLIYGCFC